MEKMVAMTSACLVLLVPLVGAIECENYQMQCPNGKCIAKAWECDTLNDCGNNEDEVGCSTNCSGANQLRCTNGACTSMHYHCDGDDDCGDNSDEIGCDVFTCPAGYLKCPNTSLCVYVNTLCNRMDNCKNNWDERPELCNSSAPPCKDFETRCDDGKCISKVWKCDTKIDCSTNEDEVGCPTNCSGPHQLRCDNERCVPLDFRCNGIDECGDNSDETGCDTFPCQPGKYKCPNTDVCFSDSQACNGVDDCKDNWDEQPELCKYVDKR